MARGEFKATPMYEVWTTPGTSEFDWCMGHQTVQRNCSLRQAMETALGVTFEPPSDKDATWMVNIATGEWSFSVRRFKYSPAHGWVELRHTIKEFKADGSVLATDRSAYGLDGNRLDAIPDIGWG